MWHFFRRSFCHLGLVYRISHSTGTIHTLLTTAVMVFFSVTIKQQRTRLPTKIRISNFFFTSVLQTKHKHRHTPICINIYHLEDVLSDHEKKSRQFSCNNRCENFPPFPVSEVKKEKKTKKQSVPGQWNDDSIY